MSVFRYRPPARHPLPWWWFGPYVIIIVIYLTAVLALLHHGQELLVALGVPAAVSAVAVTAVDRLGRLAGFAAPSPVAVRPRPRGRRA